MSEAQPSLRPDALQLRTRQLECGPALATHCGDILMLNSTPPVQLIDPREAGPKPPFPKQEQPIPGGEAQMQPLANHGEKSYKGSGRLAGLKALITGADSGIGRAVALAFAREGANVAISYLDSDEDAQATARLVEEAGQTALLCRGDIGDPAYCKSMVEQVAKELGGIDILVNNAAYQQSHDSIREITPEELERTFRTNIFAMFYLCQNALPLMKPGASVINTASVQAYQPDSGLAAYAATKAAIVNFTKSFSEEAIESGVRVNAVAPGPVWTPLIPSTLGAEEAANFGAKSNLGRPAQPGELAPIYVLLASPEASYITGMVYGITGGTPID